MVFHRHSPCKPPRLHGSNPASRCDNMGSDGPTSPKPAKETKSILLLVWIADYEKNFVNKSLLLIIF